MYLNGFHFYADDMWRQIEAHHYCSHVTEEFYQCVIYDGNEAGARLIGVEYIVSERIFKSFPEEEKALWHSHRHETLSGTSLVTRLPSEGLRQDLRKVMLPRGGFRRIARSYGLRPAPRKSSAKLDWGRRLVLREGASCCR
jgi:hypothetical protein